MSVQQGVTSSNRALEELVRSFGDEMLGLAYLLTGNREEAQDIVQGVWLNLAERDLASIDNAHAYLRRSVTNACTSWGRTISRKRLRSDRLQQEWVRLSRNEPDIFSHVEMMTALAILSRRQRAVVTLRYYAGLSDQAIAEIVKCSPATVRSILSRSLTKLQSELRHEGP